MGPTVRSRHSYGHNSNALKLLSNLRNTTGDWSTVSIVFFDKLLNISERNRAINFKILRTDGVYLYYKADILVYIHIRKRHFLFHINRESRLWSRGDAILDKGKRQEGSWPKMWRVDEVQQVEKFIAFVASLPMVRKASLLRAHPERS